MPFVYNDPYLDPSYERSDHRNNGAINVANSDIGNVAGTQDDYLSASGQPQDQRRPLDYFQSLLAIPKVSSPIEPVQQTYPQNQYIQTIQPIQSVQPSSPQGQLGQIRVQQHQQLSQHTFAQQERHRGVHFAAYTMDLNQQHIRDNGGIQPNKGNTGLGPGKPNGGESLAAATRPKLHIAIPENSKRVNRARRNRVAKSADLDPQIVPLEQMPPYEITWHNMSDSKVKGVFDNFRNMPDIVKLRESSEGHLIDGCVWWASYPQYLTRSLDDEQPIMYCTPSVARPLPFLRKLDKSLVWNWLIFVTKNGLLAAVPWEDSDKPQKHCPWLRHFSLVADDSPGPTQTGRSDRLFSDDEEDRSKSFKLRLANHVGRIILPWKMLGPRWFRDCPGVPDFYGYGAEIQESLQNESLCISAGISQHSRALEKFVSRTHSNNATAIFHPFGVRCTLHLSAAEAHKFTLTFQGDKKPVVPLLVMVDPTNMVGHSNNGSPKLKQGRRTSNTTPKREGRPSSCDPSPNGGSGSSRRRSGGSTHSRHSSPEPVRRPSWIDDIGSPLPAPKPLGKSPWKRIPAPPGTPPLQARELMSQNPTPPNQNPTREESPSSPWTFGGRSQLFSVQEALDNNVEALGGTETRNAESSTTCPRLAPGNPWEMSKLARELSNRKSREERALEYELSSQARQAVGSIQELNTGMNEEMLAMWLGSDLTSSLLQ